MGRGGKSLASNHCDSLLIDYIFTLWLLQLTQKSSKYKDKSMSSESSKTSTSSVDIEKAVIIPHIVVNVIEEEHLKLDELLKNSSLPALDQVCFCIVLYCDIFFVARI